ncbi:Niemann-Pick C2 protein [Mytilus galloprovincialis]|uniref:Niemann-Pick C2 protein n=1 Tax=Mytilus galloprovincialis TaxID=29158 RepID=A0A8B6FDC2_MYTGA|nr:Niemann-Pick C2 protein [Mytilus galloprovincialis]
MTSILRVFLHVWSILAQFIFGAVGTEFKDCGSSAAIISTFEVSDCPKGPCLFKRGTNVTLTVQLTPNDNIKSATTSIYGYIGSIKTPFILNKDACVNSIKCPIEKGVLTTFTDTIYVESAYPKLRLVADLEVKTDDGKLLICTEFPAEITD